MTLNCKGKLIHLDIPKVMGILNITPDSFFDGGKYKDESTIIKQTTKMLTEGATFIDIGAYSSRPGASHISEDTELQRIVPIIKLLVKEFPNILISVDTFRSKIASECLAHGATMINDISAGLMDNNMLQTIADYKVPYIMMHMKGTPATMQQQNIYSNLIEDILFYFSERIATCNTLGITDIVIDPGFGFAKNTRQNYELLQNLNAFKSLNFSILAGLSRKSMIYKTLNTSPSKALNGTTALHMVALQNGAHILRVHDVKEAVECIQLYQELKYTE